MIDTMTSLRQNREDLLRQYILSSGSEKAEILRRILDIEEEIEEGKANM